MKPQRPKPERLADVVDRGQRIADLINDPVVAAFLDDEESLALETLMSVTRNVLSTVDSVRASAVRYDVVRNLRRHLNSVAADGARVMKNMSEI
jgi:hypothetical protein